jgi:hypothetical protein
MMMKLGSQTLKSKFSTVHKKKQFGLSYIDMEIQIYILSQLTSLENKFTNKGIHKVIKLTTTKTNFHPFVTLENTNIKNKKNTLQT